MVKAFARSFGVLCITLGLAYGAEKLLGAPPELLFLAPAVTLAYLGGDILLGNWVSRRGRRNEKTGSHNCS